MKLAELQKKVSAAIVDVDFTSALSTLIVNDQHLDASKRLAIYRESKLEGLHAAMALTYPVCNALVGEQFFSAMVSEYLAVTPSVSPNLDDYGHNFNDFIADFSPAQSLPYLRDVASLEWAWQSAQNGVATTQLDFRALGQLNEEEMAQLVFKLPGNAQLLASDYPIDKIWQSNQDGYAGEQQIHLDNDPVRLIIWRPDSSVLIERLSEAEWLMLQSINNGLHLEDVIARVTATLQHIDVEQVLPKLTQRAWLADFTLVDK